MSDCFRPGRLSPLAAMRDRAQLIAVCIERGGYLRGARMAEFITEWEVAVRKHGRAIGIEEFAHYWKASYRTAYRRLADFRELFGDVYGPDATPSVMMGPLLDRLAYDEPPYGVDLVDVPLDLRALA